MNVKATDVSPVQALSEPSLAPAGEPAPPALEARYADLARVVEGYARDGNVQRLRALPQGSAVRGGYSDELGRGFLVFEVREAGQVIRGLVMIPGGSEHVQLAAGPDLERSIAVALFRRPLSIRVDGTVAGGSGP
ncbi:MAG: hypothetical protein H0T42_06585 [Deltaproteobacteria bacterium]|nr:hypothetical protein [Deltaproteobacteria bacterium]